MNFVATPPQMNVVILSDREREYLVRAIESALHVRKRHQFFLWAQGQFRGVLPHEVLACIRLDKNDHVAQLEFFHSRLLDEQQQQALCDPSQGLAIRLARLCGAQGSPLLLAAGGGGEGRAPPAEFDADFSRCGLQNALGLTTDGIVGGQFTFILFDLEHGPSHRQAYFLELMLPHLQVALVRLQVPADGMPEPSAGSGKRLITEREAEILRLVQHGNSNHAIGSALGISPLTVKNHVQKICRKLDAQNRAHAVSRGISLRLLDSSAS